MQNPLANFIAVFSLVRDDRGFQVNPLCRHNITSPFPPSGNGGCVRNLDGLEQSFEWNGRAAISPPCSTSSIINRYICVLLYYVLRYLREKNPARNNVTFQNSHRFALLT